MLQWQISVCGVNGFLFLCVTCDILEQLHSLYFKGYDLLFCEGI